MRFVGAFAHERQGEGRLADLPGPADERHLAGEDRGDGGFEVAAAWAHEVDSTPLYS